MKTIGRIVMIVVVAMSIAWVGNLAVSTLASTPPAFGEMRPHHDEHEHHERAGAGRAGELGASLALMFVVGSVTVLGSRWSRRLRRRKYALHTPTRR